jgi:hypothetical protein
LYPSPIIVKLDPLTSTAAILHAPLMNVPKATRLPSGEISGFEASGAMSPFTITEIAALALFETERTMLHDPVEFEE